MESLITSHMDLLIAYLWAVPSIHGSVGGQVGYTLVVKTWSFLRGSPLMKELFHMFMHLLRIPHLEKSHIPFGWGFDFQTLKDDRCPTLEWSIYTYVHALLMEVHLGGCTCCIRRLLHG